MTQKAKNLIKNYEGCRLTAYKCAAGVWTLGWGHTGLVDGKKIQFGMKITQAKADALFDQDYNNFKKQVKSVIKVDVNENQLGALTSFAFNLGIGALKSSTLLKKLNNKDYKGAAEEFLRWNKAGNKVLEGLVKRRKAERELFLTPCGQVNNTSKDTSKPTPKEEKKEKGSLDELPCEVKTLVDLNIREAAGTNYPIIRVAKKGTVLKVWAVLTSNGEKWGKNGKEYYCLKYCEVI